MHQGFLKEFDKGLQAREKLLIYWTLMNIISTFAFPTQESAAD
jgi:hypothetical protein